MEAKHVIAAQLKILWLMPSSEYFFPQQVWRWRWRCDRRWWKKLCQLLLKKSDTHEVENRARTLFCSVLNAKKVVFAKNGTNSVRNLLIEFKILTFLFFWTDEIARDDVSKMNYGTFSKKSLTQDIFSHFRKTSELISFFHSWWIRFSHCSNHRGHFSVVIGNFSWANIFVMKLVLGQQQQM